MIGDHEEEELNSGFGEDNDKATSNVKHHLIITFTTETPERSQGWQEEQEEERPDNIHSYPQGKSKKKHQVILLFVSCRVL